MMKTTYGYISQTQIAEHKEQLHKSVHRLLTYKEENYPQLNTYISTLLFKINGLNMVLKEPPEMLELLSLLQAAKNELEKKDFSFYWYRKFVLDAHSIIDKIKEE